jgi:hypothetical protein
MQHPDDPKIANFDPAKARATTESGELERPVPGRRKIDCVGNPEVTDRRVEHRGGRRVYDVPKAG